MRDKCYFKQSGKCTYPKLIRFCPFCTNYLENNGDLSEKVKFLTYVTQRNYYNFVAAISLIALILSVISIVIDLYNPSGQ